MTPTLVAPKTFSPETIERADGSSFADASRLAAPLSPPPPQAEKFDWFSRILMVLGMSLLFQYGVIGVCHFDGISLGK